MRNYLRFKFYFLTFKVLKLLSFMTVNYFPSKNDKVFTKVISQRKNIKFYIDGSLLFKVIRTGGSLVMVLSLLLNFLNIEEELETLYFSETKYDLKPLNCLHVKLL